MYCRTGIGAAFSFADFRDKKVIYFLRGMKLTCLNRIGMQNSYECPPHPNRSRGRHRSEGAPAVLYSSGAR
jgi:hypothetical protein